MIQMMLKHAAMSRNETSNATEEASAADATMDADETTTANETTAADVAPADEAEEAPGTSEEIDKIDQILKELDIDGNGQIDIHEFYAFMWKEMEPRQKHLEER